MAICADIPLVGIICSLLEGQGEHRPPCWPRPNQAGLYSTGGSQNAVIKVYDDSAPLVHYQEDILEHPASFRGQRN